MLNTHDVVYSDRVKSTDLRVQSDSPTLQPKEVKYLVLSDLYLRVRESVVRAKDEEEGQGMVEYALILVLIAVVVIVILTVVGKNVSNTFSTISNSLNTN
jgi:pilus assembly protein Flp/PilA